MSILYGMPDGLHNCLGFSGWRQIRWNLLPCDEFYFLVEKKSLKDRYELVLLDVEDRDEVSAGWTLASMRQIVSYCLEHWNKIHISSLYIKLLVCLSLLEKMCMSWVGRRMRYYLVMDWPAVCACLHLTLCCASNRKAKIEPTYLKRTAKLSPYKLQLMTYLA